MIFNFQTYISQSLAMWGPRGLELLTTVVPMNKQKNIDEKTDKVSYRAVITIHKKSKLRRCFNQT